MRVSTPPRWHQVLHVTDAFRHNGKRDAEEPETSSQRLRSGGLGFQHRARQSKGKIPSDAGIMPLFEKSIMLVRLKATPPPMRHCGIQTINAALAKRCTCQTLHLPNATPARHKRLKRMVQRLGLESRARGPKWRPDGRCRVCTKKYINVYNIIYIPKNSG